MRDSFQEIVPPTSTCEMTEMLAIKLRCFDKIICKLSIRKKHLQIMLNRMNINQSIIIELKRNRIVEQCLLR
jgi:hypothetical protein